MSSDVRAPDEFLDGLSGRRLYNTGHHQHRQAKMHSR